MFIFGVTMPKGRYSLVKKFLMEIKNEVINDDFTYIVIYSTKDVKVPGDFYSNVRRVMGMFKVERPCRGTFICYGKAPALILLKLLKHYNIEGRMFKVIEES